MLYKLVAPHGRWKFLNELIFSNVVWLQCPEDAKKYTLIGEDGEPLDPGTPSEAYLVTEEIS